MLWHNYKCHKIESSVLQVRLKYQSNTLITKRINHVSNSNKSAPITKGNKETQIHYASKGDHFIVEITPCHFAFAC